MQVLPKVSCCAATGSVQDSKALFETAFQAPTPNKKKGHLAAPLQAPEVAADEEEVEDRELGDQAPDRPQVRQGCPQMPASGSPISTYLLSNHTARC